MMSFPYYFLAKYVTGSPGSSGGAYSTTLNLWDGTTTVLQTPWPIWTPSSKTKTVTAANPSLVYYVSVNTGSDTNNGLTPTTPFKTLAHCIANATLGADTTVFIMGGTYREGIALQGGQSGTAGHPLVFAGYGDSEVILDGSTPVTGWVNSSGTVWTVTASFAPGAIVIGNKLLRQTPTLANVTSGSGLWYLGTSNHITADFGTGVNPNTAYVTIPGSSGSQYHVYWYGSSYVTFVGLTIRGSAGSGVWGYGSNIILEHCNMEFNYKHAVNFTQLNTTDNGCQALYCRGGNNVLQNWPRGNGGFAQSGGGWAGGIAFTQMPNSYAVGCISHDNGGEGIISYGTGGNALFEKNVSMDNWSCNMYFDNQVGCVSRQNMLLNHPMSSATMFYGPNDSNWQTGSPYKFSTGIMLADEYGSGNNGAAALSNSKVYNNLIIGCRLGIRDYSEGTPTIAQHGLKNTLIANNTIIMPDATTGAAYAAATYLGGIFIQDNGTQNTNSFIQNNVVISFGNNLYPCVYFDGQETTISGITLSHNVYWNPDTNIIGWRSYSPVVNDTLAQWQSQLSNDSGSSNVDPLIAQESKFTSPINSPTEYVYTDAAPGSGSPLALGGVSQSATFTVDLTGSTRGSNFGIGALV